MLDLCAAENARVHTETLTRSSSLEHASDAGLRLTLLRPMALSRPLNCRLASPSEFPPGSSHNHAFHIG